MTDLRFRAKLDDLDIHGRQLRSFTPKKQRSILRSSINSSTQPIRSSLRRYIRSLLWRFGNLAKAVRSKVKSYASGVVFVLVGVRDRRLPDGENPGKYFHLADAGTRPHSITTQTLRVNGVNVRLEEPFTYQHPGADATHVRDKAFRAGVPKMQAKFLKQYTKRLLKCVRD